MSDKITPEEEWPVKVLPVADFPLVRRGLVSLLTQAGWLTICGEAGDAAKARQLCTELQPPLAIIDLELTKGDGLALVRDFAQMRPEIRILALSDREEPGWVRRAFSAGARGFVSKLDFAADIATGLWRIYNNDRFLGHRVAAAAAADLTLGRTATAEAWRTLSNRELAVLRLVAAGKGPQAMAQSLQIEVTTVETHLHRIKAKLSLRDGSELKRTAAQWAIGVNRDLLH